MRLKLTFRRAGEAPVDLAVTVDATATVGLLATALARRDPRGGSSGGAVSLAVHEPAGGVRAVEPGLPVNEAGIRSGVTVSIVPSAEGHQGRVEAAATLVVLEGPDAGKEFGLRAGTNTIGRDWSSDVRLTDPLVSKRHARISVTGVVELIDSNSANGVLVAGSPVPRTVLRGTDSAQLGDTVVAVRVRALPGESAAAGVAFNRPPRLDPVYAGEEHLAPEPPQPPEVRRFPMVMLAAPVLMGLLLYAVTKSLTSLLFIGLSPVMLVGSFLEARITGRRGFRQATEGYRAALSDLDARLAAARDSERERRQAEHPAIAETVRAAEHRTPLLWTRRPLDAAFLELRLGLGTLDSRHTVKLPTANRTTPQLWSELLDVAARHASVSDVPVVAQFRADGAVGVAGAGEAGIAVARGLVAQLVALHSPAEVVLAAVASTVTAPRWDWLKWLPHTSSPHSPVSSAHLAANQLACVELVAELEELVEQRAAASGDPAEPALVLLVEDDAPIERSRLVQLAESGRSQGLHVLWVAASTERLPAACRTFLDVTAADTGTAGYVVTGGTVSPVSLEPVTAEAALALAQALSPLVDSGARTDDDTDLPNAVSFLTLAGRELATSGAAVMEKWVESGSLVRGAHGAGGRRRRAGSLRALVGQAGGDPFYLDLREHGPHALVGGTTGAGKSELLQSWILGMAAFHSPERVTFLLVDYKGGAAFGECRRLPHSVGLVTDLSPPMVRRALTSLDAELHHRERLLNEKRAKDLRELEQRGDPDAPPSLVIVVDEFAALVQEVPEFVDGVGNVAQRGRSLGLHLILATQRPAGVIKDNLRANTNLRVALRVSDEADSVDVLGSPQAAGFDPAIPGRAVAKTGPGRLVSFQAAYAGGWTTDEPPRPTVLITELGYGAGAVWEEPDDASTVDGVELGPVDISRVVDAVRGAAELAQLPEPRRPWLPMLAPAYDLAKLPTRRRDDELVFGVRDDPRRQAQPAVAFAPDRDGNLAVYGTGGAGKSTLLRTLAIAAGHQRRGGPCHVYGLDFGARGLHMLEQLPHVGAIITGDDSERIARLLGRLRVLIDERADRYTKAAAGSITQYRELAGQPDEPRILLLVDGVGAFRQAYEVGEQARLFETFLGIAADGRPVGVHVVVSADRAGAVPSGLASAVQRRVVLRLAEATDYVTLGVGPDALEFGACPGRAVLDADHVQVAVIGGSANVGDQASATAAFAAVLRRTGAAEAQPVERLPEQIRLTQLPASLADCPVLGMAADTLGPAAFVPRGTFVVTGPPGSGRTTALATVARSIIRWRPAARLYYVGTRRSALVDAVEWAGVALTQDAVAALAADVGRCLADGAFTATPLALIVESVADFVYGPADQPLQDLIRACLADEHLVVAEGETNAMTGSSPLQQLARTSRTGIALQPDQVDGAQVFRTPFPRVRRADFPVGRGLFAARGKAAVVQVAAVL